MDLGSEIGEVEGMFLFVTFGPGRLYHMLCFLRNFMCFFIRLSKLSFFHSSNQLKYLPYQILGGKTVKYVQFDPKTMEIWSTELIVTLSVTERASESVSYKLAELLKHDLHICTILENMFI